LRGNGVVPAARHEERVCDMAGLEAYIYGLTDRARHRN